MLSKKFRDSILKTTKFQKLDREKKITQYARYVVDTHVNSRDKLLKDSKAAGYGFSPISPLCAVLDNGNVDLMLMEFNIVNHFLAEQDDAAAVDVVKCMLAEWCNERKDVKDFDIDTIDTQLSKIEKDWLEKHKIAK